MCVNDVESKEYAQHVWGSSVNMNASLLIKAETLINWFHKINLALKRIKMSCLCLQECTRFYAHENPAVSRNWKIHFRSVQQTIWQHSWDDSPLHSEQTANPWSRTHVSVTSCHWTAALATAFLLHHFKAVSAQWCKEPGLLLLLSEIIIYLYVSWIHGGTVSLLPQNIMLPAFLLTHLYTVHSIKYQIAAFGLKGC